MTLLYASDDLVNQPLLNALTAQIEGNIGAIKIESSTEVMWKLLDNDCDAALVSPLVYARNQIELSIIDGVGVAAVGPTSDTILVFNPGLHHLQSIGYYGQEGLDTMLTSIVLHEKYAMSPSFSAYQGPIDEALTHFDAMLITKDYVTTFKDRSYAMIDIVDEWYDMVQFPFVRAIIAGWNHRLTSEFCEAVAYAGKEADSQSIKEINAVVNGRLAEHEFHSIPGHYRYNLDEDALESLDTFFRFAFYHGLHRDIPNFNVWKTTGDRSSTNGS